VMLLSTLLVVVVTAPILRGLHFCPQYYSSICRQMDLWMMQESSELQQPTAVHVPLCNVDGMLLDKLLIPGFPSNTSGVSIIIKRWRIGGRLMGRESSNQYIAHIWPVRPSCKKMSLPLESLSAGGVGD